MVSKIFCSVFIFFAVVGTFLTRRKMVANDAEYPVYLVGTASAWALAYLLD